MRKKSKNDMLSEESKTRLRVLWQGCFEWACKNLGGNVNACGALSP